MQTPPALARTIVERLAARGVRPSRILEPSCGTGAFLRAARSAFPSARLAGIELREGYVRELRAQPELAATLHAGDALALDLPALLRAQGDGDVLVLGNLPWITTDALGRMGAAGPRRSNPTGLRGLDARTGAGSFDLAELLALRLFEALAADAPRRATFAMLLKASVARRLLRELRRRAIPVVAASVTHVDARRAFGAAVDACLLEVDLAPAGTRVERVAVAASLHAPFSEHWYVSDDGVAADPLASGGARCALIWRQGIKHDAAAIFELSLECGRLRNGLGEPAELEDEVLFPLVRARDLARGAAHDGSSFLLVPYRDLRADEAELSRRAPRAHAYLAAHAARLAARRSSIYRGAARFAIFGVGPYAFAPWKVAVSGLHRDPRFVVLGGERAVQLSDTAYALAFARREDALAIASVLNSPRARRAMHSAIFPGKRPVTKRLLARLDLAALAACDQTVAGAAAALAAEGLHAAPEAVARRLRELIADGDAEVA